MIFFFFLGTFLTSFLLKVIMRIEGSFLLFFPLEVQFRT